MTRTASPYPSLTRPRAKGMKPNRRGDWRSRPTTSVINWTEVRSTPATTVKRYRVPPLDLTSPEFIRGRMAWRRERRRQSWPWWKTLRLTLAWHLGRKPLR